MFFRYANYTCAGIVWVLWVSSYVVKSSSTIRTCEISYFILISRTLGTGGIFLSRSSASPSQAWSLATAINSLFEGVACGVIMHITESVRMLHNCLQKWKGREKSTFSTLHSRFLRTILHLKWPSSHSETVGYVLNQAVPKIEFCHSTFSIHSQNPRLRELHADVLVSTCSTYRGIYIVQVAINSWPTSRCAYRQSMTNIATGHTQSTSLQLFLV